MARYARYARQVLKKYAIKDFRRLKKIKVIQGTFTLTKLR